MRSEQTRTRALRYHKTRLYDYYYECATSRWRSFAYREQSDMDQRYYIVNERHYIRHAEKLPPPALHRYILSGRQESGERPEEQAERFLMGRL